MKKVIAVMMAIGVIFSFCACGSSNSDDTSSNALSEESSVPSSDDSVDTSTETSSDESSNEESSDSEILDAIVNVEWVSLYYGNKISFEEDGTMTIGECTGEWKYEDDCITLDYTLWGSDYEYYYDVIEDSDGILLERRDYALVDGSNISCDGVEYFSEERAEEEKNKVAKETGETASTDIIDLQIKKASLGFYAENFTFDSRTGLVSNPESALEPASSDKLFTSSKGRCLLCLDLVLTNNDRNTINTSDGYCQFYVKYDGNIVSVNGYDLNDPDGRYASLDLGFAIYSLDGEDFYRSETSNDLIAAGSTIEYKLVGVVGFEPDDLNDEFDLIVSLKNSNGEKEMYIYQINQK